MNNLPDYFEHLNRNKKTDSAITRYNNVLYGIGRKLNWQNKSDLTSQLIALAQEHCDLINELESTKKRAE